MDEDDDFGEFGGFEATEPTVSGVAAPIAASTSPWAVFTSAPVDTNTGVGLTGQTTDTNASHLEQPVSRSETVQPNASGNAELPPLSSVLQAMESPIVKDGLQLTAQEAETKKPGDDWLESLKFPSLKDESDDQSNLSEAKSADPSVEFYKQQIQSSKEEKYKLEKELQSVCAKQLTVDSDLAACQKELEEQKEKYEELQKRHMSELEAMRKAGMDALAVIVEEYKELCKVSVIEQKEACERLVKDKLQVLTDQCQQLLEDQHSRLQTSLEEDRLKQESVLAEALSNQQAAQQSRFDTAIEEEKKSLREVVSTAIEEIKESNEKVLMASIERLRSEGKTISGEQKALLAETMEERFGGMKMAVLDDLAVKQKESEATLRKVMDADSQKSRDIIRETAEKTKAEMMDYIQDQKRADVAVRSRQLSSLQLFLESAKAQVSGLLSEIQADHTTQNPH
ncbi:coiled-coil domain-containing protein 91-like [Liolophura sinensis]|uniref:coiled-coil domain-containing protein 91-like n=1 Tax=Liolophura sinensis TaxID=3198878 RepID=UPI003158517C